MEQGVSTLEVRSSRDGAWYAAKPVLEPSLHPTLLPPPLHLRFEDYGPEEDEIWAVKRFSSVAALRKHMRPVSNIMQDDQCPFIHQGLLLCVACDGPGIHGFPFYDAVVCEVDRTEHTINAQGGEECNCIFEVEWENGPLRRKKSYVKCGQICFLSEKNIEDDPTVRSYIEAVKSSSLKGGKFLKDSVVVNNTKESNDDEPLCTMMKIKGKTKFKESGVAREFRTASILKNQKTRKSFINKSVGKSCGNKGKGLEDTLRSKKYKKQRLRCMLSWEELKTRKTEANFSLPSVVDAKIPLITVEAELSTGIKNLSKDFNAEELKYPCNPAKEETSRCHSPALKNIKLYQNEGLLPDFFRIPIKEADIELESIKILHSDCLSNCDEKLITKNNIKIPHSDCLSSWDKNLITKQNSKILHLDRLSSCDKNLMTKTGGEQCSKGLLNYPIQSKVGTVDVIYLEDSSESETFHSTKENNDLGMLKSHSGLTKVNPNSVAPVEKIDNTNAFGRNQYGNLVENIDLTNVKKVEATSEKNTHDSSNSPCSSSKVSLAQRQRIFGAMPQYKVAEMEYQKNPHDSSNSPCSSSRVSLNQKQRIFDSIPQYKVAEMEYQPPSMDIPTTVLGESMEKQRPVLEEEIQNLYKFSSPSHTTNISNINKGNEIPNQWETVHCHMDLFQKPLESGSVEIDGLGSCDSLCTESTCCISSKIYQKGNHSCFSHDFSRKRVLHGFKCGSKDNFLLFSCHSSTTSPQCYSFLEENHFANQDLESLIRQWSQCNHSGNLLEDSLINRCKQINPNEIRASQLLLIENMEINVSLGKLCHIVSNISPGFQCIHFGPSLPYESWKRGYVCYQDARSADIALSLLSGEKLFIVSSKGRPWIISRVYGNFLHQDFPRVCAVPDLFEGGHQQKGSFEKNTSRGLHLVYRDSSIYDQIKQRVKAFLYHQRELGLCHLQYMQTEEKLHALHL